MVIYLDTDIAVNSEILKDHPIPGPIILEYYYGVFNETILGATYNGREYKRPKVIKHMAISQYWDLIDNWRVPTQYDVFTWARDIIRHIIAMNESFNTSLGILADNPNELFTSLRQMTSFCKDFDPDLAADEYGETYQKTGGTPSEKVRTAIGSFYAMFEQSKTKRVDIRASNLELIRTLSHIVAYNVVQELVPMHEKGKKVIERILSSAYEDRFFQDGLGTDTIPWLRYPSNFWAQKLQLIPESVSSVRMTTTDPTSLTREQVRAIREIIFYGYTPNFSQLGKVTSDYVANIDSNQTTMKQAGYVIPEIDQISIEGLSEKHTLEDFNLDQIKLILQGEGSSEDSDDDDPRPMVIDAPKSTEEAKTDSKKGGQTLILLAVAAAVLAIAFG